MGLFLETAIVPNCTADEVKHALADLPSVPNTQLDPAQCRFCEENGGVCVQFNEYCAGYESLAKALSEALPRPVLYLYIYDDDFWGYFLCENGKLLDEFNPMPDYFEESSPEERRRLAGSSTLISRYFQVPPEDFSDLLGTWTDEMLENDETGRCDCWVMAEFMERLGFPYPWG